MPDPQLTPYESLEPKPRVEDEKAGFDYDLVPDTTPHQKLFDAVPVDVALAGIDADRLMNLTERFATHMVGWDPFEGIRSPKDKPGWAVGDPYGATFGFRPKEPREASERLRKTAAEAMKAEAVERSGKMSADAYVQFVAEAEAGWEQTRKYLEQRGLRVSQHWTDAIKEAHRHLDQYLDPGWQSRHVPMNQKKLMAAALIVSAVNGAEYDSELDAEKTYAPLITKHLRTFYKAMPESYTDAQMHRDFTSMDGLRYWSAADNPYRYYNSDPETAEKTLQKHYEWIYGHRMPADMPFDQKVQFATNQVKIYDRLKEAAHGALRWKALGVNIPLGQVMDGKIAIDELPFARDVLNLDWKLRSAGVGDGDRHSYAEYKVREHYKEKLFTAPEDVVYQTIYGLPYRADREAWIKETVDKLKKIKDPGRRYIVWNDLVNARGREIQGGDSIITSVVGGGSRGYAPDPDIPRRWQKIFDTAVYQDVEYQNKIAPNIDRNYDPALDAQFLDAATRRRVLVALQQKLMQEAQDAPLPKAVFWAINAGHKAVEALGLDEAQEAMLQPLSEQLMSIYHNGDHIKGGVRGLPVETSIGEVGARKIREDIVPFGIGKHLNSESSLLRYAEKVRAGTAGPLDQVGLTAQLLIDGMITLPALSLEKPLNVWLLGKVLHGYGRTVDKAATAMINKGMHPLLAGTMEFLANPTHVMAPFRRLALWSPAAARAVGRQMWTFKREFNKQSPKMRRLGRQRIDGILEEQAKSVYGVNDVKIAELRALSSDMFAQAENAGLSWRTTWKWGEAMKEIPLGLARDLNLPYAKSQFLVGNALQNAKTFQQVRQKLVDAERIAAEGGAFNYVKSPEALFIEMLNTQGKNRLARIDRVLNSRLLKAVPAKAKKLLRDYFDTRLNAADLAPHVMQETGPALKALEACRRDAICRVNELTSSIKNRQSEIDYYTGEIRYHQTRATLVGMAENEAAIKTLRAKRARAERHRDIMQRIKSEILDPTNLPVTGDKTQIGDRRVVGIETGYNNDMPADVKRQMIRDRIVSCERRERAWADFDQGERVAEIWRREYAKTPKENRRILDQSNRLNEARRLMIEGELAGAAKLLGYKKKPPTPTGKKTGREAQIRRGRKPSQMLTEHELLDFWESKTKKLQADYLAQRERRFKAVEAEAMKLQEDIFNIKSVDQHYQEHLKALRQFGLSVDQLAQNAAEVKGGPAASYQQWLKLSSQMMGVERNIGLSELYTDSTGDFTYATLNRLQANWDNHGPRERQLLTDIEMGRRSLRDPKVRGEILTMAFEDSAVRNSILQMLVRVGKITPEQYQTYRAEGYETRVPIKNYLASELRQAGFGIGTGSSTPPATDIPQFRELRAKRSTRYVRQFYRKGWKVHEKRFYVDKHGGPEGALKEANKWVRDQVASKRLRKTDILETKKAVTDAELGAEGIVDDQGLVRFKRLRNLVADVKKLEFFNHVALMNNMARGSLADVPESRRKAWTEQPLEGKEWGNLQGKYVHKNLFKIMNSWTGWSRVLENAAKAMEDSARKAWGPLNAVETLLYGEAVQSNLPMRMLRWADRQLRQHMIVHNPATWVNNHLFGMYSMWQEGTNPAATTTHKYMNELDTLLDKLSKGQLKKTDPMYSELLDFIGRGGLSMSMGAPGQIEVSVSGKHGWRNFVKEAHSRLMQEQRHKIADLEMLERTRSRALAQLELKELPAAGLRKAEQTVKACDIGIEARKGEILMTKLVPPHLKPWIKKKLISPLGRDALRVFYNANKSHGARMAADLYGMVDARYKWASYRTRTEIDGWSKEHALAHIASHYQNYPTVPLWVRNLRRTPIVGAFVPSFPYEAARLWGNFLWENPSRALSILFAPFIWNLADMSANGILPSDYFEAENAHTTWEKTKSMFFKLNMHVDGHPLQLDITKATGLDPFLDSQGLFKGVIDKHVVPGLDDKAGPGIAIPATMALNYASNFVANTPWTSMGVRIGMGIDPYTQDLTYNKQDSLLWNVLRSTPELQSLVMPRIFQRALPVARSKYDNEVTSLITQHNRPWLSRVGKKITGQEIRQRTPREMVASLLLDYYGADQKTQLLREAWGAGDQRLYELEVKIRQEVDPDRRNELVQQAAAYYKQLKADKTKIGSRVIKTGVSTKQAVNRVLDHASRNILQIIERIPIERMPEAAYDVELFGYSRFAPDLTEHCWRQLIDDRYLSGHSDIEKLVEAWGKCASFRQQAGDERIRLKFDVAKGSIMRRIREIRMRRRTPFLKKLLRAKAGNWQRTVWEEFAREAGLTY